jgi:hypothetical protein
LGVLPGAVKPMAFALDTGLGQFAQSVENAGVGARMLGDLFFEDNGVEGGEEAKHPADSNPETGFVKEGAVFLLDDVGGEIEAEAHFLEPSLVAKPVLIAAGVPAGEVIDIKGVAMLGELLDDQGVRRTIAEHEIEPLTKVSRQASDLARSAVEGLSGWSFSVLGWLRVDGSFDVRLGCRRAGGSWD